jgi:hypothetical protein
MMNAFTRRVRNVPARLAAVLAAIVLSAAPTGAQVTDRLGVPGPIELGGRSYHLAWSASPNDDYIKQEYVPPDESVESYRAMVLVELATGGVDVADAVRAQTEMLAKRKGSDPLVNFSVLQHDSSDEMLLDFIVSSKDANGEYIVEWDAYRYAPYRAASGATGVLLYGVSHRAYGNADAKAFLSGLKPFRRAQIDALTQAPLPQPER